MSDNIEDINLDTDSSVLDVKSDRQDESVSSVSKEDTSGDVSDNQSFDNSPDTSNDYSNYFPDLDSLEELASEDSENASNSEDSTDINDDTSEETDLEDSSDINDDTSEEIDLEDSPINSDTDTVDDSSASLDLSDLESIADEENSDSDDDSDIQDNNDIQDDSTPESNIQDDNTQDDYTPESDFNDLDDSEDSESVDEQVEQVADEINGTTSTVSTDNIESYMTDQAGGYLLSSVDILIEDISIPSFMKKARSKTYMGLVKSVSELGVLTPISVTYSAEYVKFKKDNPDTPYTNPKYVLLDGYRRLFALYRNGIQKVRATLFEFDNPDQAAEVSLLFKCILNKYTPSDIEENNSISDLLQDRYSVSQSTIEYLLSMHSGDFMKLKDIVNSSDKYPEIKDDLFSHKKGLEQAFKALQAARKKEDQLRIDDTTGIGGIDEAKDVVDNDNDQPLSEDETLEILDKTDDDMSDAFTEGVSDGDISMAPEDYGAQKEHERHPLDPALRQAVLIRDDFRCVVCGRSAPVYLASLVVHHPIPVYGGGTDKYEEPVFFEKEDGRIRLNPANNLVTLCDSCHEALHAIAFKHRGKLPISASYYDSLSPKEQEQMKRLKLLISVEAAVDRKLNRNQHALAQVKHRMPGEGYEEVLEAYNNSEPSPASNVVRLDDSE